MKYYNQDGEEVFGKEEQIHLNRIRKKIYLAEIRLDNARASNKLLLARSIEAHIDFLIRQENKFYKSQV